MSHFDAMLKRPKSHARDPDEIIVYWIIVCPGFRFPTLFGEYFSSGRIDCAFSDASSLGQSEIGTEALKALKAFLRFLISPVFSHITPVTYRRLSQPEIAAVAKVLAWTAPMAALLLKRLTQQWEDGTTGQVWNDYLLPEEVDYGMGSASDEGSSDDDEDDARNSRNDSGDSDDDHLTDIADSVHEDANDGTVSEMDSQDPGASHAALEPTQVNPPLSPLPQDTEESPEDSHMEESGDEFGSDSLALTALAQEEAT
jgi:hypothetical protein